MSEPEKNESEERLIGEPIVNRHGDTVHLGQMAAGSVVVHIGPVQSCYAESQVILLGDGNFDAGVARLARTYGQMSMIDAWGSDPFAAELNLSN